MRLCSGLSLCCFAILQLASGYPSLSKRHADFESVRTHLERDNSEIEVNLPDKYFHEALFGSHYDGRFADKPLSHDERRVHLTLLIQTYLSVMNSIGTETWLMHGSLLGWYWNRKVMPWDDDLDVSMSEKSMHHLAAFYNMTVHHFTVPGSENGRDFLLEINPHYIKGEISDKDNKIDARWVDTDTGLFIDITTLRRNLTAEALGIEGAMMIKDRHHYMYDDIYPLRETEFEGAPAKVPFAYAELLVEEYGDKALTQTNFNNHRFDTEKQEWIPLRLAVPQIPSESFSSWTAKYNGSNPAP